MVTGWNILLCLTVTLAFVTAEKDWGKEVVKLTTGVELPGVQLQEGETTVYYGIKYGTAGRFEHAQPNTNFSYLNIANRLQAGHVCPQLPSIFAPGLPQKNLSMSEDCLYLDVYVPPSRKEKATPRPVLFWIYGGGFKMGDKDLYNSTILAKAVDAIVVAVNYRVSAFGFLSTGDEVAPGNWALGDLKLALNWTIDNIAAFGGDPAKVTIFGESAGAVLTSALLLDDDVRYKVKAGIAFSGSSLCRWAMNKNAAAGTLAIAGHLGCPNTTSSEAVACLRTLPYEVLLNGTTVLEKQLRPEDTILDMHYTPVIDGFHIRKLPEDILRDRATASDSYHKKKVATFISGYLREDVSLFTLFDAPHLLADNVTHTYASALDLLTVFITELSGKRCSPAQASLKAQEAFEFYNVTRDLSSDVALSAYHQIASDLMFGVYAMKESMMHANTSDGANQMFLLSYDPGFKRLGAFHAMEVFHLFRGEFDPFLEEKTNDAVSKTLHDYVHQIAYTGRHEGPFFGPDGNYHELTQDGKFVNKRADFSGKLRLLEDILKCGS